MKRVVLHGYHGRRNTGDDAFALLGAWGAREYWRLAEALVVAPPDELPVLPAWGGSVFPPVQRFPGHGRMVRYARLRGNFQVFSGLIMRWLPRSPRRARADFLAASLGLFRLGAIGATLGPFISGEAERYWAEALKRFRFLVLRDRRSYETALAFDLPYEPVFGADLALLLGKLGPIERPPGRSGLPLLGVSLSDLFLSLDPGERSRVDRRVSRSFETIVLLAKRMKLRVRILEFHGHPEDGDAAVSRRLWEKLAGITEVDYVPYNRDTLTTLGKVAECDAMFTVRLHAGIFSAISGVPFLQVEYGPKCVDFLDDIGVPAPMRIGDFEVSPEEAARRLGAMLESPEEYRAPVPETVLARAERNFTAPRRWFVPEEEERVGAK